MGNYIFGIIGAAAVIGIMDGILPQSGKTKNYMRLITGLCLLCLLIKPVGAALDSLPALIMGQVEDLAEGGEAARGEYEEILEGEIRETVAEQLRDVIKRELGESFGVSNCEVGISLIREEELRVERVVITLMGKDIFKDPYAIEAHFADLLSCECVVIVG